MTILREIYMLYMYDTLYVLKHVHNSRTLVVYRIPLKIIGQGNA